MICTLKLRIREMPALVCVQLQSCEAINQQEVALALLHQDDGILDIKYVWCAPV